MISARDLVAELNEHGVSLFVDKQKLGFTSTRGLLDRHRDAIARQKPAILDLLQRPDDHAKLMGLRLSLGTDEDRCHCGAVLGHARLYQCKACAERFKPVPGPQEPSWSPAGGLRIPFGAAARFRWWQGGQPPDQTARELGATEAQAWRYTNPFSPGAA